jgi:hypothetical protein
MMPNACGARGWSATNWAAAGGWGILMNGEPIVPSGAPPGGQAPRPRRARVDCSARGSRRSRHRRCPCAPRAAPAARGACCWPRHASAARPRRRGAAAPRGAAVTFRALWSPWARAPRHGRRPPAAGAPLGAAQALQPVGYSSWTRRRAAAAGGPPAPPRRPPPRRLASQGGLRLITGRPRRPAPARPLHPLWPSSASPDLVRFAVLLMAGGIWGATGSHRAWVGAGGRAAPRGARGCGCGGRAAGRGAARGGAVCRRAAAARRGRAPNGAWR